ncbi:arylamine N-acetyltransferase, pineal gland isozyme NAT-10-like [Halichoeres trimaculatus]|uniref:arylamine N-acetyltransferase, pineal gland isozyme NAT-10-like n=1 Tax=Halichoeres trimaculatus TaxID=147232 RepID=UPI003D9E9174
MNLEEYFQRIGFHGSFDSPDLTTLRWIHKQHVMSIPFENFSIHCGERITLDLEIIFEKVVRSRRGGWCMENNFLFGWVLREMGYDTTTLGSTLFCTATGDFPGPETHLINMVTIEGQAYLADVSYGESSQPWEPLELVSGKGQPQGPGVFRLTESGGVWVLEKTGRRLQVLNPDFAKSSLLNRRVTRPIYSFTLVPRDIDHFYKANDDLQIDPTSPLTNKSMCSLQTPTGFRALVGWTYSEVTYQPETGVDVYDMRDIPDGEMDSVLEEKFKIKLKNKLQIVNRKVHFTL